MPLIDARKLMDGPQWAVAAIVISNLIPVFGVAVLGWDAAPILMLYWAENIVVGLLTLPRILAARGGRTGGPGQPPSNPLAVGCFFVVHYGIFCIGHLVFALALAGDFIEVDGRGGDIWSRTFGDPSFSWAVLAIAGIHIVMQIRDWWMVRAWRDASPTLEMFRPYGRIFVLHLTVLMGAWLMLAYKAPAWSVLLLCLCKAVLELVGAVFTGRLTLQRP